MSTPLDLAGLIDLLGHDDHTAICTKHADGPFATTVVASSDASEYATPQDRDVWFGVNPIGGPARDRAGRGTSADVTRLAALYADLDIKPGGLASFDEARQLIDDLSEALTSRPAAFVMSGHGVQPYWLIDDTITGSDAAALLRRFGRLVRHFAEIRGGNVDSVFDLARILRAPGSRNHKNAPVPVLGFTDTGHALDVATIEDALLGYGIAEQASDRQELGTIVAPPAEWEHADATCAYVRAMIKAWRTDTPTARHPWLVAQATRLAAAHRHGCITRDDHTKAVDALRERFGALLATGDARTEQPGEVLDALTWGQALIASKHDTDVLRELGGHTHLAVVSSPPPPTPTALPASSSDGAAARVVELTPAVSPSAFGPTEDGVARALAVRHADDLRYCPQRGKWLTWSGSRWAWDDAGLHREHIKELARDLPAVKEWETFTKRCLSASGVRGIAELARSIPTLVVDITDLDARPYELNTPAGIVDLRSGRLQSSDPARLHTRTTSASPDFEASAPRWERFLSDTFGGDAELVEFVQRLLGVALIGTVLEQVFVIAYGEGANGKSTLFETVKSVLSSANHGYAGLLGAQALLLQKFEGHPTDIAQLAGQRFTITSELPDEQRFNEEKIKKLTGGDTIDARFMRQDTFTFEPSHTLFLLTNYLPAAEATSPAFWRRVIALPFNHVVPFAERDKHLKEKLLTEADAILAWMVRGAAAYLERGLDTPAVVTEATAAYAAEQDTITGFLEDCCHVQPSLSAPMASVRTAYEQWCYDAGKKPATVTRFGKALKQQHGISEGRRQTNGARVKTYVGLGLAVDVSERDDHDGDRGGW